ncbi:STAS domain-containing protein [Guggenheimella bovis]
MAIKIRSLFSEKKDRWEVKVIGEVDIDTAAELKQKLIDIIEDKNRTVIINAEELDYIDSTGLGMLIGIVKRLRVENNDLIIAGAKPSIVKLLKITGLDKVFLVKEE